MVMWTKLHCTKQDFTPYNTYTLTLINNKTTTSSPNNTQIKELIVPTSPIAELSTTDLQMHTATAMEQGISHIGQLVYLIKEEIP